ncbi:hypothetical protein SCHPADRAFT_840007, partial [Schizopora paradoxa]
IEEFIPLRDGIIDQLLMLEIGPEDGNVLSCVTCNDPASLRCISCFGNRILCKTCIIAAHASSPFHFVEEWNGHFWERTTLHRLGYTLHLGHDGDPCPMPDGSGRLMHIVHCTGVHDLRVVFCGCHPIGLRYVDNSNMNQLLRARVFPATPERAQSAVTFECLNEFHILTTQGKLTAMDYYETLSRLTDNTGIDPPKFLRTSRLWRSLTMMKRAGVFFTGGVDACTPGSCAVPCYACPYGLDGESVPGMFDPIPEGDPEWANTDYRQLDANFRLKLKQRGFRDRPLNLGCAYIVSEPPYKAYVEACGPQTEVNICDSGLHAVDHANLRGGAAYIASGVGACQCRHMMVMPAGVGDLQKGEKSVRLIYSNMDYIFASASRCAKGSRMVVSYDIACQWHRNFPSRCETFPDDIAFDPLLVDLVYVIPKFHIHAHGSNCQSKFSLNYRRHMGRTDGENIERGWAWMNPASLSTREMGPGSRADTLDDQWGAFNYATLTRLGVTLGRRLFEAHRQAQVHRRIHTQMSSAFPAATVEEWSKVLDDWAANPFDDTLVNPFTEPESDVSVADVRRELNDEEEAELTEGVVPEHSVSASKYLVTGLQLEDQQCVTSGCANPPVAQSQTTRSLGLADRELELKRKIIKWIRRVQPVYMPGFRPDTREAAAEDSDSGSESDDDSFGCRVWEIELRLPSSLSVPDRTRYCVPGLVDKEHRLRLAQAEDALVELRRAIRTVTALELHKSRQTAGTGVAANTRMLSLIARHKRKRSRVADRYRAAREALLTLEPDGAWQARLLQLNEEHIRPPHPDPGTTGQGTFETSWIWLTGGVIAGVPAADQATLDDSVRTDWAKALARAERWEEEVVLIPIEMRRVLRGLVYKAHWWRTTASGASGPSVRILSGYVAYAMKQARVCESLAESFASLWLPLFTKLGFPIPEGWPRNCMEVKNQSTRGVVRRLPWLQTARIPLAARVVVQPTGPNQPPLEPVA